MAPASTCPAASRPFSRSLFDDGWQGLEELPAFRTTVFEEKPKTIITRNDSPDIGFDRSINPYRGCEHGCSYCYARPAHAYMGLSPGLDFESKLFAKPDAAKLLRAELSARSYVPKTIALGANTDAYQPIERERRITRAILEVLVGVQPPGRHRHQVGAGDARHRHPGAHGAEGPGQGGALRHLARPEARPRHGAARLDPGEAAGRHRAARGGGHPHRR